MPITITGVLSYAGDHTMVEKTLWIISQSRSFSINFEEGKADKKETVTMIKQLQVQWSPVNTVKFRDWSKLSDFISIRDIYVIETSINTYTINN